MMINDMKKKQEEAMDSARAAIRAGLKKAGDIIESAGDRVEHAGFKKLGDLIERWGDQIEHLGDQKEDKKDERQAS